MPPDTGIPRIPRDPGIPRIPGMSSRPAIPMQTFISKSQLWDPPVEGPFARIFPKGAKGRGEQKKPQSRPKGSQGGQSWPEGRHRHAKDTHRKPEGQDIYLKTPDQLHGGHYVLATRTVTTNCVPGHVHIFGCVWFESRTQMGSLPKLGMGVQIQDGRCCTSKPCR